MIIQTVSLSDFRDAFRAYNRLENFSHEGCEVLFNYLEEMFDSTGTPYELDVIALCCEYTEVSAADVISNYSLEVTDDMTEKELNDIVRKYLQENTCIIGETSTGFVYLQF